MKLVGWLVPVAAAALMVGCSTSPVRSGASDPKADAKKVETDAKAKVDATAKDAKNATIPEKPMGEKTPTSGVTAVGDATVTCSSGKEERVLSLKQSDTGCELQYTKGGETKTIAQSARKGSEYCGTVLNKTKTNLEGSGYKCQ